LSNLFGVFFQIRVRIVVGVNYLKLEIVDIQNGANIQVAQGVILGKLDRVPRLVGLLYPTSFQEFAASETFKAINVQPMGGLEMHSKTNV
jgi:hypothetical protein